MNQYILIDHIKVQNANAIAGFTWGFPAITHFLGFTHNLSSKLATSQNYSDITLFGCVVTVHEHHAHTFGKYEKGFIQSRNPAYLKADVDKVAKGGSPSVIEEGKMNMTVSLLIQYEGNIGNRADEFSKWLETNCYLQRLAGGTILNIKSIIPYTVSKESEVKVLMRKLLPGFVLMDRSNYLKKHYEQLLENDADVELLDAWLDFSALKQKARPKSNLITKHLNKEKKEMLDAWQKHLELPFEEGIHPQIISEYFDQLEETKENVELLKQWKNYQSPNEKTDANWEYLPKPNRGYLVPIMTGYKALTQVYTNIEVKNTRDNKTDVCFVESVHSTGEWLSAHRINSIEKLKESVWNYAYEENWYLCKQNGSDAKQENRSRLIEDDEDLYS